MEKYKNPFLHILPREKDKIIKEDISKIEKFEENIKKDEPSLILIKGTYGVGKSQVVKEITKRLGEDVEFKEITYSKDITHEIREIPGEIVDKEEKICVIIDKFELIESTTKDKAKKILDLIKETQNMGVNYIISITPEAKDYLIKIYPELGEIANIYEVKPLTFKETKKLVKNRLNEVRKEEKDSLDPFEEDEIKRIWESSNGNPRMILMICATLYEEKRKNE